MSSERLQHFMDLFDGRKDVYGSVEGLCIKEPVTPQLYQAHLNGKKSLGIYMLLDDGTCNFFAVDLDENNFAKAKLIRGELGDRGIRTYIAKSKSKGYHIYGFGKQLVAKDVRRVLCGLLSHLKINAEVFPKQDELDEVIPIGNYINLPCFGKTRQWLTADEQTVPVDDALHKIQLNIHADFIAALDTVPDPGAAVTLPVTDKKKGEKGEKSTKPRKLIPPCIEKILKGVESGRRDEAGFALARYYLDNESPEDALAHLLVWDARNKPPLGNMRILQQKVTSAGHGYAFGCGSITDGLLSDLCVGRQKCPFLKQTVKERKKEGSILETSFYEDDNFIYDEIVTLGRNHEIIKAQFVGFNKETGEIFFTKEIQTAEKVIWPIIADEIAYRSVRFPTGIADYGSTVQLLEDIKAYINWYTDIPGNFQEFAAWYVLMTWVYNRLPTMLYLRFLGDLGTGKSRTLDTVGGICYKRMGTGGVLSMASLYRLMRKYEGTVIIDEADFGKSDETVEIIKMLNSGIERNAPIIKCSQNDFNVFETFPVFGPKAFGTRKRFKDEALESRCLSSIMQETDREDIPNFMAFECEEWQTKLRQKLLLWRFQNLNRIPEQLSEKHHIDLGEIEGRLKQVCVPFAMLFQDLPETMDRFKRFLADYTNQLRSSREQSYYGRLIYAMFKGALLVGRENVTVQLIKKISEDELNLDLKPHSISRALHELAIETTTQKRIPGTTERAHFVKWDKRVWRKVYRKYLHALNLSGSEDIDDENDQILTQVFEHPREL